MLLLFSVLFFGKYWYRLLLFFFLLGVPAALGIHVLALSDDWFRLDDEKKRIVKARRTRIPYEQVKSVEVREVRDHLEVDINRKRMYWGRNLILHLSLEEKDRLMSELAHRFPAAEISETKIKPLGEKFTALAMAVVLLGSLVALGPLSFGYVHTFPGIEVTPEKPLWQPMEEVHGHRYSLKAFSFFLPHDFQLFAEGEERLVLRHKHKKAKLAVQFRSDVSIPRKVYLVRYLMGARDKHDGLVIAYTARFGLVPLVLKGCVFPRFYVIRVYEVEPNGLKGFLARGRRGSIWMAEITLVDKERGVGIDFTLSSMEPIDIRTLATIIASVRRVE